MITRFVKLTFEPEKTATFIDVFESSKNLIRNFEGCHHLELLNDVNQPNVFFTLSKWESEEALNKYRYSELFRSVWAQTKIHFAAKPETWSLHVSSTGEKEF